MINYSIAMRSVNANLFETNQAKARINKAKKEGKERKIHPFAERKFLCRGFQRCQNV